MTMGICHKIMKTAEEYLKENGITPETVYHNYAYVYRVACDLIGEAQKEAYNQAIDQILKLMYDHEEEIYIGVFEDIEKLKK